MVPVTVFPMREFLLPLTRDVGALLRRRFSEGACNVRTKSPRNLVTDADLEAEKLIRARIREAFPDHAIIGEEMESHAGRTVTWHIDPIDGTTNFAFGIPHWCVSIAAVDSDGPLIGTVYDPVREELFFAERGRGAFLNDCAIHIGAAKEIPDLLAATGFASMRGDEPARDLVLFQKVVDSVLGIRRMGSAALDLAYVAHGRFDIFFEEALASWDIAAGALLVTEAGGAVRDYRNGEDWLERGDIIAGRAENLSKFFSTLVR